MENGTSTPQPTPSTPPKLMLSELQFSEKFNDFAAAFVAAQAEIVNAKKAADNEFFKSKYAELADVSDACRPALNKNGIGILQTPIPAAEPMTLSIETRLLHKSGQWAKGTMSIPLLKRDPQGYGSTLTYARRYHLAAITGVCPEDDDGNAASEHDDKSGQRQTQRPQQQDRQRQQPPAKQPPANPPNDMAILPSR